MFNFMDLFAQSYSEAWKRVEKYEEDGLPKSALSEAVKIRTMADRKGDFAQYVKASVAVLNLQANVDPDTFMDGVEEMEKNLQGRKNAVERSVVDAVMSSSYKMMLSSYLYAFDEESRAKLEELKDEHFSHILDDMGALADANARDYESLVSIEKDGELYNHDMLNVMIAFVKGNSDIEMAQLYAKAVDIYKAKGMKNAYALMMLKKLESQHEMAAVKDRLSDDDYTKALYELMMEMKGEEATFDVMNTFYDDFNFTRWKKVYAKEWGWEIPEALSVTGADLQLTFLNWAIENIGNAEGRKKLEYLRDGLLVKTIRMSGRNEVFAGKPYELKFEYWNCNEARYTIRKYEGKAKSGEYLETGSVVQEGALTFGDEEQNKPFTQRGLPVRGEAKSNITLQPGKYLLVLEGAESKTKQPVHVTSLRVLKVEAQDDVFRLMVCDNETGRPVSGVAVEIKNPKDDGVKASYTTDAKGMVTFNDKDAYYVRAVKGDDVTEWETCYNSSRYEDEDKEVLICKIYTDRSIYRPGQKVMANMLFYSQNGDDVSVAANRMLKVQIKDNKSKTVKELELATNKYGTADIEYTLPEDSEVGYWTIVAAKGDSYRNYGSCAFKVEEYKRPTFDVKMENGEAADGEVQKYAFGNTINVRGVAKEFSGMPVQGAKVTYRVSCSQYSWRFWNQHWTDMSSGECVTDDDGQFVVPVLLDDSQLTSEDGALQFRVMATVVDQKGETHEGEWRQGVSKREFGLTVDVDGFVDKAKGASLVVKARDVAGNDKDVMVTYTFDRNEDSLTVKAGENVDLSSLAVGKHSVLASAKDCYGNEIYDHETFVVYDSSLPVVDVAKMGTATKVCNEDRCDDNDMLYSPSSTYSESKPIDVFFSTSETDAYIIYNVYGNNGLLEEHFAVTDGKMKHLRIKSKKEWGEGIKVQVAYVRNGHYCTMEKKFTYVKPEKALKLSWQTFRNKLQPGQQEEWVLCVTDAEGKAVSDAEVMAVMYDASLDYIYDHDWSMWLGFNRSIPNVSMRYLNDFSWPYLNVSSKRPYMRMEEREFDWLDYFRSVRYGRTRSRDRMVYAPAICGAVMDDGELPMLMAKGGRVSLSRSNAEIDAIGFDADDDGMDVGADGQEGSVSAAEFDKAVMRENFNETAFFMPHLVSDRNGAVKVAFTLPESLTEWKFMSLAHTQDVCYGKLVDRIKSQKDFTIRPNMPRFVRWGDSVVLTSAIANQSEKTVKGDVRMRLVNPDNGKVVIERVVPFAVEAGKTTNVDFAFEVKEEWLGMNCEIVAVSGNTSDGEMNFLPVLSTKKEVVESVPFCIMGNDDGTEVEKTVDLSALFNKNSQTAVQRGMKIEYTDNPAWMCVEALRDIKVPALDDAVDYAAALYANTRLVEFVKTFPMLEKYENASVLQAGIDKADAKLADLQKTDGGWSWFKGMESSYYITLAVCEHLAKMPVLTGNQEKMLLKGLSYLDNEEMERYKEMKKKYKSVNVSESTTRYLYVSSLRKDRRVGKDVQMMREEYLKVTEKTINDFTLYGVANAACALRAFGHEESADRFVESLKQYSVEKPNQGRCYVSDAAYYSWMDYRIPTHVAAMKAIFDSMKAHRGEGNDEAYLRDMQLWLISQKQVQKWDNPMNTINVVDLLLAISPQQTFHEAQRPVIALDGKMVDDFDYGTINTERDELEGRESNLYIQGNVLADVPAEQLADGVKVMSVKKSSPSISWGAAYATFLEDIGNLGTYGTNELRIERKLYRQPLGEAEWKEMDEDTMLKVGDKVRVRSIITADRDMDFVCVKAQHPACFEPVVQNSGYRWMGNRGAYVAMHDSGSQLFFDWFTRGTTTFDMEFYVARAGKYQGGISTVECTYAKQFGGHTDGYKVQSSK